MSQTLTSNDLNMLLIKKNLMEQKITELQNELNYSINTLNAINSILESYYNVNKITSQNDSSE